MKNIYTDLRKEFPQPKLYITDSEKLVFNELLKEEKVIIITTSDFILNLNNNEIKLIEKKNFIFLIIYGSPIDSNDYFGNSIKKIKRIYGYENLKEALFRILNKRIYNNSNESLLTKHVKTFTLKDNCILQMFNNKIFDLLNFKKFSLEQSIKDFVNICDENKINFEEFSPNHLDEIKRELSNDNFKNDVIINWYTKESYFYNMLNENFRHSNFSNLFRLRYPIFELKNALSKYKINENKKPEFLYRATKINESDLNLLLENDIRNSKIIQFRGFSSTSNNIETQLSFAETNWVTRHLNEKSVIFKIKLEKNKDYEIYDIRTISDFNEEDEFLISSNTFIKINSIEKTDSRNIDYSINCFICDLAEVFNTMDKGILDLFKMFKFEENYNIDNFFLAELYSKLRYDSELEALLKRTSCENLFDESDKNFFYGVLYYNQGKYEDALKYYFSALKIFEENISDLNKSRIGTSYYNIGVVYNQIGNYTLAKEYFSKSMDIRKKFYNSDHPKLAYIYNGIGGVCQNLGEYGEALKYYFITLKIFQQTLYPNHTCIATLYNNIGSVYYNQGKYDETIEHYMKALNIREEVLGREHPETADTYNNIGTLYETQNKLLEAIEYYSRAFDIYKKNIGINHPNTATISNNIGSAYKKKGEYKEALDYFLIALQICKETVGTKHFLTASINNNISSIYEIKKDFIKSFDYCLESLKLKEEIYGVKHPTTAVSYFNLALINKNIGKNIEALELLNKSFKIYNETLGEDHPYTASCYCHIAEVYENIGKNTDALEFFNKSLKIYNEIFAEKHFQNVYVRKKIKELLKI